MNHFGITIVDRQDLFTLMLATTQYCNELRRIQASTADKILLDLIAERLTILSEVLQRMDEKLQSKPEVTPSPTKR